MIKICWCDIKRKQKNINIQHIHIRIKVDYYYYYYLIEFQEEEEQEEEGDVSEEFPIIFVMRFIQKMEINRYYEDEIRFRGRTTRTTRREIASSYSLQKIIFKSILFPVLQFRDFVRRSHSVCDQKISMKHLQYLPTREDRTKRKWQWNPREHFISDSSSIWFRCFESVPLLCNHN